MLKLSPSRAFSTTISMRRCFHPPTCFTTPTLQQRKRTSYKNVEPFKRFFHKPRVVVGMSGGVDSSVAAHLLASSNKYDVTGVYMNNWDVSDEIGSTASECSATKEYDLVTKVCDEIKIPCQKVTFVKPYWNRVFEPCLSSLEKGLTPNPDILCNREIKFKEFAAYARDSLGADYIATGHYAKVSSDGKLFQAADANKDQTYFLSSVSASVFSRVLFPLADLKKSEVREIAKNAGLCTALAKESMGICFIGKRKFKDFISDYVTDTPSSAITIKSIETNEVLSGSSIISDSISTFTIGQASRLAGMDGKFFVVKKDIEKNVIYVARGTKHPALYTDCLYVNDFNWISSPADFDGELKCQYRVRHRQELGRCTVTIKNHNSSLCVKFHTPHRAVTPGQAVVLYNPTDGMCYGGGSIISTGPTYYEQKKELPRDISDWHVY